MALAAIPAAIETAIDMAPTAIAAAKTLHGIGMKYAPTVKKLVTNVHPQAAIKTAKDWLKDRFTSTKGLKKLITKDLPSAASKTSNLISSGKLLSGTKEFIGDVGKATNAVSSVVGNRPIIQKTQGILSKAESGAERFHDTLSRYNESGKNAVQQWKNKYGQ